MRLSEITRPKKGFDSGVSWQQQGTGTTGQSTRRSGPGGETGTRKHFKNRSKQNILELGEFAIGQRPEPLRNSKDPNHKEREEQLKAETRRSLRGGKQERTKR
jgi:hypothetical protein